MLSKRGAQWKLKDDEQENINDLVKELGLDPVIAKILANRGLKAPQQVEEFLDFSLERLNDPYLLPDMKQAVARIKAAIKGNEQIVIYGDYDVDGITATSLLVDYLKKIEAKVDYYIPNRLEEGYGLNVSALESLAQKGAKLIITVDCGIKAHRQIKHANQLGLDMIITDHHHAPQQLPDAVAIVNPKRADSSYPFSELAGVGVAFKLAAALELEVRNKDLESLYQEYLDLVALGTVADIVPLVKENRIMVKHGLVKIKNTAKLGLAALVEVSQLADKEINTGRVGYNLAPKINAAGRIGDPALAVELLLAQEKLEAKRLAKKLEQLNKQRQEISRQMFEEAEAIIEQLDLKKEWFLVLASPNWHPGIAGNVASDICEKYHRPTILISQDSAGKWQGSGRSIKGFNIYDALLANEQLLERFGGHKQAAGLTITEENIKKLRANLNDYIKQSLEASDLKPVSRVDVEVGFDQLDFALVNKLEQLAPFGLRNPRPVLMSKDVTVKNFRVVGKDGKHLKLTVSSAGEVIDAIAFNQAVLEADLLEQKQGIEVLFNVEINQWQGNSSLQLKVKDFKFPQSDFITNMFIRGRRKTDAAQLVTPKNCYTEFVELLSSTPSQQLESLAVGDRLLLVSEVDDLSIKVLTFEQRIIGYLSEKLSRQLIPSLILGIEYDVVISQIIDHNDGLQLKVFIQQATDKEQISETELESEQQILTEFDSQQIYDSLIKQQNTLAVWPAEKINLNTLAEVSALEVIKLAQIVVVVIPFARLTKQRYRFFKEKLSSWGIKVFRGSSSLTLEEKEELKFRLHTGQLDLLLVTPEFVKSHLEALDKIKDKVGLLALDYNYELELSRSQFQQFHQVALNLIDLFAESSILALLAKVNSELKKKITTELEIEETVIADVEPNNYCLLDNRNHFNKIGYIKQLIAQEEKVMIYVNTQQQAIDLAIKLRANNPDVTDKIIYYHSALTTTEKNLIKDKFKTGELEAVVATEPLCLIEVIRGVNHIIFVQPPFNQSEFNDYIAQVKKNEEELTVHLLYQDQDLETNQILLERLNPGREILVQLYILLVEESSEDGVLVIAEQELVDLLALRVGENVIPKTIVAGLDIFMELKLINVLKREQHNLRIKLYPQPKAKLDLASSMRYNEGVKEKKRFDKFKEAFLNNQTEKLISLIN
ncbi:single-stranded-DNA-specific exonuclease RecJ [Natroniella sulfidigena]|uniref:single-stranded-DNA-specific exonuclease RecJ n=1 Tax=Natroniella sulfidigena TaxID=723921 RepID=UPI00200A473C|nr:single-stranded-DNA-specific exonuclease RecJ [Natroniella sulfidigena]MCK8815975.1 single-stranded-DNA-specific exonuclease RecJ [Natroniella sulfidigena]